MTIGYVKGGKYDNSVKVQEKKIDRHKWKRVYFNITGNQWESYYGLFEILRNGDTLLLDCNVLSHDVDGRIHNLIRFCDGEGVDVILLSDRDSESE